MSEPEGKRSPTCSQKDQSPAPRSASAESGNTDPTCCRSGSPSLELSSRLLFLSPLPFVFSFFLFLSYVPRFSLVSLRFSFFLLIRNYIALFPNFTLQGKSQKQCCDCTPRSPPFQMRTRELGLGETEKMWEARLAPEILYEREKDFVICRLD